MQNSNWFESFKIGVPIIDSDHLSLFNEIHKLQHHIKQGASYSVLEESIHFLYQYVGAHFAREEQLMLEKNYPKYAQHKAMHHHLKKVVYAVEYIFRNSPEKVDQNKLQEFLEHWLKEHILGVDIELEPYINGPFNKGDNLKIHQHIEEEISPAEEMVNITLSVPANKIDVLTKCAFILSQQTPEAHDLEDVATKAVGMTMEEAEKLAAKILND